jgi:1,4-alpha-glucan branching enzyme
LGVYYERRARKKIRKALTRKIIFTFHSPTADEVFVAGTFNNWEPRRDPLRKNAKGWSTVKYLEPGTYEYRFIVDGVWMDDPICQKHYPNQYGSENCVLEV